MRYGGYRALLLLHALAATARASVVDAAASTTLVSTLDLQDSFHATATAQETVQVYTSAQVKLSEPTPAAAIPSSRDVAEQLDVPSAESKSPSQAAAETTTAPGTAVEPTEATAERIGTPTAASTETPTSAAAVATESTLSATTLSTASPGSSSPEPVATAATVVEEVPLVEIPPAPELLSFQEWRDRYVVQLDSAGAAARRTRKAAQRVRQDAVGAAPLGAHGAMYDGDAADVGSLFVVGDAAASGDGGEAGGGAAGGPRGGSQVRSSTTDGRHSTAAESGLDSAASDLACPLQPLPNVGSGGDDDPLVLLKDRSNYAAFECAAMVHRSSRQSKGASSILVEKKDRYMLTPCSANPIFVDVELCDEIQIDTIVLANFEFFSSTFKHFKASCSVDYPGKPADWHDLGTYRANNARGVQVFKPLRNPHFCRYVRIDFLSHYGSEYYCPVSLLRVYGFTQLDAYRESERKAKALEEALAAADLIDEQEHLDFDSLELEEDELLRPAEADSVGATTILDSSTALYTPLTPLTTTTTPPPSPSGISSSNGGTTSDVSSPLPTSAETALTSTTLDQTTSSPTSTQVASGPSRGNSSVPAQSAPSRHPDADPAQSSATSSAVSSSSSNLPTEVSSTTIDASSTSDGSQVSASASQSVLPTQTPLASVGDVSVQASGTSATQASSTKDNAATAKSVVAPAQNQTATASPSSSASISISSVPVSSSGSSSAASVSTSVSRVPAAAETIVPVTSHHPVPPPPPSPPPPPRPPVLQPPQPGESIYGTIMKRLTSLEHNQTIAMYFTEAQSNMLREAFGRVERRLHDIELTRGRQEQNVRQAILDLEKQRIEIDRERLALATQVSMLAQEVRFGKRLTIAQLIGIFALIIFVGFTRGLPTSPFLHLATAAQAERGGLRWRRDRRERDLSVDDEQSPPEGAQMQPTTGEGPTRKSHRNSPSTSLSRSGPGSVKRKLSLSKPTPRRHYAVGSVYTGGAKSGLLRALDLSKASSRPRTPPMRHSSAPPEEVPAGLATALEAREALRRRGGSSKMSGPSYRFPPPARDAPAPPVRTNSARSDQDDALPTPGLIVPFSTPAAYPSPFPSPGEEADSEREVLLTVAELASPALSSANGFVPSSPGEDDGGYYTYSSNDEFSPARNRAPTSRLVTDGVAGSPGSSPHSPRPPKPHVQIRPATSMGFVREQDGSNGTIARHARTATFDEANMRRGPSPNETTPEPPPEPSALKEGFSHPETQD